jgi:hypothetical protein
MRVWRTAVACEQARRRWGVPVQRGIFAPYRKQAPIFALRAISQACHIQDIRARELLRLSTDRRPKPPHNPEIPMIRTIAAALAALALTSAARAEDTKPAATTAPAATAPAAEQKKTEKAEKKAPAAEPKKEEKKTDGK